MTVQGSSKPVTVRDVMGVMEEAYPLSFAEKWDHPGIVCGDVNDSVEKIVFAVDLTPQVLDMALTAGADMVITHHPVLFKAVHTVAANTPKGALIHRAIQAGCALYCAHTNADNACPGVNDALAQTLGLTVESPLVPLVPDALDRWVVHVPGSHVPAVQEAVFAVGAGAVGDYTECSFRVDGNGQFRPENGAQPYSGNVGQLKTLMEARLEFVAPRILRSDIKQAIRASHPYEEPSYDILESQATPPAGDLSRMPGSGKVCTLPEPLTLREFTDRIADALPDTVWGVRAAGDPAAMIEKVALCGGAGGGYLDTVLQTDVDCFVTSDLRHHPVDDYLQAGGTCVVDTAHAASEYPWLEQAADLIEDRLAVATEVLQICTDPWTIHSK